MSPSELIAINFELTSEIRKLKSELVGFRAIRRAEDSIEVARIKSAYDELEKEVVLLRLEKISASAAATTEYVDLVVPGQNCAEKEEFENTILALREQLLFEKLRYDSLQIKYSELRKSLNSVSYSEVATCASSSSSTGCYKNSLLSVEQINGIEIKPECQGMFKKMTVRRTVPIEQPTVIAAAKVEPVIVSKKRSTDVDESVKRLAKIAKYNIK